MNQNQLDPSSSEGVWTAIITPFLSSGEIDWDAYESILDKQARAEITGIVVAGSTGEASTLTVQEKLSLIRKSRAILGNKLRIMAGTGGQNTQQTVELSRLAIDAGADSLLVVTPPYSKPSFLGLQKHFEAIAAASSVPICLYHVPGRTSQLLSADEIATLAQIEKVKFIKEASGDMALFSETAAKTQSQVLSGDDPTFLSSLVLGGLGCISVVSNVFPQEVNELYKAFQKSDLRRARAIHECLFPFIQALFCESNPAPAKYILSRLNQCSNTLRLPLTSVTPQSEKIIEESYDLCHAKLADLLHGACDAE